MTSQIGSGTAQGLIEYLDQLIAKGNATPGSIVPLKSTLKQVLSTVDGEENWKNVNIRELETGDYIERFKNKTIGKYAEQSYPVYQSRLNKIKDWYVRFLLNPGWAPTTEASGRLKRTKVRRIISDTPDKGSVRDTNGTNLVSRSVNTGTSNDLITYPFPLRTGMIVYLSLPVNMSLIEARRLAKYIESLSIDENDQSKL